MSLIINKLNKAKKGGTFLGILRIALLLAIIAGPVALASMADLSSGEGNTRWYWIAAFIVLFFFSFEKIEGKYDKKGKYVFTISFLAGFIWQALLFIPFILVTHPDATQTWNCAHSIAIAFGSAVFFLLVESAENRLFAKKR